MITLSHLGWSQSYPILRIENGDTVVVMTKQQADDINAVFKNNNASINKLSQQVDSVVADNKVYKEKVFTTTNKIMEKTLVYEKKMKVQSAVIYVFISTYMYLLIMPK